MSDVRRLRCCSGLAFLLALFLLALPVSAEVPRDWLMRMADSVEGLNYEGTLVHMHGGEADILGIVHRVQDGQVSERITAMDGAGREIIRNNDQVTCILPDQMAVHTEPRDNRDRSQSPLQGRLPSIETLDEGLYTLSLVGSESVAGRAARILVVQPMDGYRYGYRLWLDDATGMPLKTQLREASGGVLEQLLFTEIRMPASIADDKLQPSLDTTGFKQMRGVAVESGKEMPTAAWRASDLPSGFALLTVKSKYAPGAEMPTEQLVYSDGLAWVSVFIEASVAEDPAGGLSTMGAANAFTTSRDGHLVTAVGEVPVRTVELIALSTSPVTP
ncbi:MAG: MucB/RseB C-terminal domain-containing protein [Gammaproteobacteria bacterium]